MDKDCNPKWEHMHLDGGGIVVKGGKPGKQWTVVITDDGSICNKKVPTPEPKPFGLPAEPAVHNYKDPVGSNFGNMQ